MHLYRIELGTIVEADGAACAALPDILGGNETSAVHVVCWSEHLFGTGGDAAPAPLAFILDDDRSREVIGSGHVIGSKTYDRT
jgi:hypothetical protein